MSHARTQIRNAVVAAVTGLASTGSAVYTSRVYSHSTVPSLNVLTNNETVDDNLWSRRVDVEIEGRVKAGATDIDTQMDQIAVEVENAIQDDPTIGGVAISTFLRQIAVATEGESNRPVGLITLLFEVLYRVNPNDPETLTN